VSVVRKAIVMGKMRKGRDGSENGSGSGSVRRGTLARKGCLAHTEVPRR